MKLKVISFFLVSIFGFSDLLFGGVRINPSYDFFNSQKIGVNRLIFSAQADFQTEKLKYYLDFFGESNLNSTEDYSWRTAQSKAYLQELYVEYSSDIFFAKVGKQATRWSDSWVLPSLDIWTARKYERLYLDPLAFQLNHSSGVSLSFSKEKWQLDLVGFFDAAEDTYPAFLWQAPLEKESLNPGARFKYDLLGFQNSFVLARSLKRNQVGYGVNYAFEKWVPKIEMGYRENEQKNVFLKYKNSEFASLGADIFIGKFTLTPQYILFTEDSDVDHVTQGLHYISVLYTKGIHELQLQEYANTYYKDLFWSFQYAITLKQKLSMALFYQEYKGGNGSFTGLVEEKTGGEFIGLKFQYFASLL